MKKILFTSILSVLLTAGTTLMAQDQPEEYLGLPGDNLNLYAVMKVFQESKTLEEFEKSLNEENSRINNLDLNGDNMIDYIRVIDNIDGDVHNIVLQVPVNERENQDVAVFTVQRYNNGQVQIQLTGDEDLYGKNYIIEPIFDDTNTAQTPNPGYTGDSRTINGRNVTVVRTTTVEIASWPVVRYIYMPSYVAWHSSWYWGYYPSYWHPWHPFYWHYYYGYHNNWYNDYYGHYRRWDQHRYDRWNDYYYTGRRSHSPDVSVRIQAGNYRNTYSHPDQRKDGEALYSKMNQGQSRRSSDNPSVNNQSRRSGSKSIKESQSVNSPSSTTRRSSAAGTNKSVSKTPSDPNTVTTRRSSSTVTTKSVTNPSSGQNASTNRSSRQSKTTVVNSSNRRSGKSTKSETTPRKVTKSKESETKKATRRK